MLCTNILLANRQNFGHLLGLIPKVDKTYELFRQLILLLLEVVAVMRYQPAIYLGMFHRILPLTVSYCAREH